MTTLDAKPSTQDHPGDRRDRLTAAIDAVNDILLGKERQVQRCELSLGLKWFEEDIDDVTAYLNSNYYNFK